MISTRLARVIALLGLTLFPLYAWSESHPPAKKPPAPKASTKPADKPMDKVLDFEGDVIEGERDRPDIFLQLGANPTADSILFMRKDFNDFHAPSRKTRPIFVEKPPSKSGPSQTSGGK